jgi:hypothetical protein
MAGPLVSDELWELIEPLIELHEAEGIDWSRASIDSSHVRAVGGAKRPLRARSTAPDAVPSTT